LEEKGGKASNGPLRASLDVERKGDYGGTRTNSHGFPLGKRKTRKAQVYLIQKEEKKGGTRFDPVEDKSRTCRCNTSYIPLGVEEIEKRWEGET